MTPILSIITGTRNREADLHRLWRSIEQHTAVPYEFIVSDASDEPKEVPGVRIIAEKPRLGCSKGYNAAFRLARGTWVIWLNDDCEVTEGYAENAIAFMKGNPHIGLGALYYLEGSRDYHVNSYYNMLYANFGILSRELGDQIGWFDESIPMYGCDNALTFRILLAGRGVDSIPGARIIHHAKDDAARRENNDDAVRIREAEALRDKYGPLLPEIQRNYAATNSGQHGSNGDQTPSWMWPAVTQG